MKRLKNWMLEKRSSCLWVCLVLFLAVDLVCVGLMVRIFPQITIEGAALLGEGDENLKEFEKNEAGVLRSLSDDPWIYYAFGEPVNVRFLTAEVSNVGGPESEVQFYLMPSTGHRVTDLKNGTITAQYGLSQGCLGVGGIRLDLATVRDAEVAVERVVINQRSAIVLETQRLLLRGGFFLTLLFAEILGWRRLWEHRNKHRVLLGVTAGMQAILKIGVLWMLRGPLMDQSGIGEDHLLCWMLVLGAEMFSIMALHIGAGIWKKEEKEKKVEIWNCYLLVIPLAVVYFSMAELLNLVTFDFQMTEYLVLNLLLCALVPSILLVFIRRGAIALTLSTLLMTILSVANHYYGMLRDNPLEYFDMANAKTAVNVVSNYALTLDKLAASVLAMAAILVMILFAAFGLSSCGYRLRVIVRNGVLTAAVALVFIWRIPTFGNFSNLQVISSEKGYLLSFLSFIKMGQIKKPENYQARLADEILEQIDGEIDVKTSQEDAKRTPNIIVIMDEAFADLPNLYGFETTEDVLPNIHAMEENAIHGRLLASVYGGGTANTEYEFLTGNSLHFLPMGCSPYVQYVGTHQQSIAWKLQNLGYSMAAYHPYLAISYRRPEAYPLLGFSEFYSIEDELPYEEYLRSYISDDADFQNVIHLYEEREEGKPFFLFNVTMQNHGGYSANAPAIDITVRPTAEELQITSLLEYLTLIHETDAAFQKLVDYFSKEEEETIILLFGDHQPSMDSETNELFDQILLERNGILEEDRRYYSNFVLWANFDIDEATDVVTSPNYLRSLLLSQAGMELNAYEQFLLTLSEEYPALNAFGYRDSEGEWHSREDSADGKIQDYRYLVYQNMFDKKNVDLGYYE